MKFHPSPFWRAVINDDEAALIDALREAPLKHRADGSEVEPLDEPDLILRAARAEKLAAEALIPHRPAPHPKKIKMAAHHAPIRREDHEDDKSRKAHDMIEKLLAAGKLRRVFVDDHHYHITAS